MDRAPLRPVPARPTGPVPDPEAAARVAAFLPALAERDGLALALVALAGHPRAEVARRLAIDGDELAATLARARKELRRTSAALPGSGWCERAERLVSDRLDQELAERDQSRLTTHLRNCPRCVEHERRLVQATDALVASPPGPAVPLRPAPARPEAAGPEPTAAAKTGTREVAEPVDPQADRLDVLPSVAGWYVLIAVSLLLAVAALALAIAGAA